MSCGGNSLSCSKPPCCPSPIIQYRLPSCPSCVSYPCAPPICVACPPPCKITICTPSVPCGPVPPKCIPYCPPACAARCLSRVTAQFCKVTIPPPRVSKPKIYIPKRPCRRPGCFHVPGPRCCLYSYWRLPCKADCYQV